jgi:hypothetical protein
VLFGFLSYTTLFRAYGISHGQLIGTCLNSLDCHFLYFALARVDR